MRAPVQRNNLIDVTSLVLENQIAVVLNNLGVVPSKLPHGAQRKAELLRIDELRFCRLEIVRKQILLMLPGPRLIGDFPVWGVDNPASCFLRRPVRIRGTVLRIKTTYTARWVLKAAHSV